MRSLTICTPLFKYYPGDQIEKNETGGTCSTYGERRGVYRILVGKPEGKRHLKDPGIGKRILLRWILRKWDGGQELD